MADPTSPFTPFVPGFDFLQGLVKNAGEAMPGLNQWIAPTLDPEELEKRIRDLRTVQFWLEQNAKMIGATVQALEVQRMTLNTLKSMNLPLAEVGASMKMRPPEPEPEQEPESEAMASPESAPRAAARPAEGVPATGAVDPMQWWGALTQQFTEIAGKVMKDAPAATPAPKPAPKAAPRAKARPAAKPAAAAKRRSSSRKG